MIQTVASVITLVGVVVGALWLGSRLERERQIKDRDEALKHKKTTDEEVDSLSHAELDARFRRWMRPPSK